MPNRNAKKTKPKKPTASGGPAKRRPAAGMGSKSRARLRWVAFFLFAAAVAGIASYDLLGRMPEGAMAKGVVVGPVMAGERTIEDVEDELESRLDRFRLTYRAEGQEATVGPFTAGEHGIVNFHRDTALSRAYDIGRNDNPALAMLERLGAAVFGAQVFVPYSLDEEALMSALELRFGSLVNPAQDAELRIAVDDEGDYEVAVVPERDGTFFRTDETLDETRDRLRNLSGDIIDVSVVRESPDLRAVQLEPLVDMVGPVLERAPREFVANGSSWTVTRRQLSAWMTTSPAEGRDGAEVGLDQEAIRSWLEEAAEPLKVEPRDALFETDDEGRVVAFRPSVDGEGLDLDTSLDIVTRVFLSPAAEEDEGSVELPIATVRPDLTTEASNPFGIREMIGIGETNFRGSPSNRRHNIATGAASLHGLLIPPDTEFSLIEALGDIDAENGYLEELVIKQNETKPEFGGGLCQIGTTTFRAVMNSGLPITERRNHSYRVSYYERDGDGNNIGPGKDATIYDPWPDFKFRNDTPAHVLIQTAIDGDRLSFYFWGTDDGRVAEEGEVSVWGIEDPPPKKEIPTTSLEPGKWKCTEHPHPGAKTRFTYSVTYADGEVVEEDFYSNYRPWQEVCLIGATAEEVAAYEAAERGEAPPAQSSESSLLPTAPSGALDSTDDGIVGTVG